MKIAVLLYDGFTALDAVAPIDVLTRLPDATLSCVSDDPGPVPTEVAGLALEARPLSAVAEPDIVVVPGGSTTQAQLGNQAVLEWLTAAHATSTWTTSVCTGSLLLGAVGALRGRRATSHWYERESMRAFGAEPAAERVVVDGKVVTAAGVSAGIDMALRLTELIAGREYAEGVQLAIEYDPQPPFDSGSVEKAPEEVYDLVRGVFAESLGPPWGERGA